MIYKFCHETNDIEIFLCESENPSVIIDTYDDEKPVGRVVIPLKEFERFCRSMMDEINNG